MSRRRHPRGEVDREAGTDSFLDILANLVGILVILVVVVAIRVRQTVRVDPSDVAVMPVETPVRVTTRETSPIPVSLARPLTVHADDPEVSEELRRGVASARLELKSLQTELLAAASAPVITPDPKAADELRRQSRELRNETARQISVASARAADLARMTAKASSLQASLDEPDEPAAVVESLHHEVRPLARQAGRQVYVHLEAGRLTVIPGEELIGKALRHQRNNVRHPRYDGVYTGRVGPVDGVTLSYETRRSKSAMDAFGGGGDTDSQYWFEVQPDAESEPIERAVAAGSAFRRTLATLPSDATLSCIVKPDSFAEARTLQAFVNRRSQRLAFLPTAADVPALFGSGGTRIMGQ